MSKMVSARVPDALYEHASNQLASLGFTTSDLVNSAFEYVLKEKSLPKASGASSKKRSLSKEQKTKLANLFHNCTLGVSVSDDISHDKQIAHTTRIAKYEDIA